MKDVKKRKKKKNRVKLERERYGHGDDSYARLFAPQRDDHARCLLTSLPFSSSPCYLYRFTNAEMPQHSAVSFFYIQGAHRFLNSNADFTFVLPLVYDIFTDTPPLFFFRYILTWVRFVLSTAYHVHVVKKKKSDL